MLRQWYTVDQTEYVHSICIGIMNRLQTPDFLLLRYDASASPVLPSMTFCAILTSHDPLHDLAEKCYALTVCNHGAIWVVVG